MSCNAPRPRPEPVLSYIRANLTVDEYTGALYRNGDLLPTTPNEKGYLVVNIHVAGKQLLLRQHHICWYLYYGEWPKSEIDHDNRDKTDNSSGT